MIRILPLWFVSMLVLLPLSADVDLKEVLAPDDFVQAGLDQLDPAQLDHLNRTISELMKMAGGPAVKLGTSKPQPVDRLPPETPSGDDAFGLEAVTERVAALFRERTTDEIVSRIPGRFPGWSGKTVFELDNGQVWRQVGPGEFVVSLENPEVTIRRASFGSYLLSVDGYNSSVRVRRLK